MTKIYELDYAPHQTARSDRFAGQAHSSQMRYSTDAAVINLLIFKHMSSAAFIAEGMMDIPSYIIHIPEGDLMARLLFSPRNQIGFDGGSYKVPKLESSNISSRPALSSQLKHAPPLLLQAGQVRVEMKTTDHEGTLKRIADAVHLLRQWGRSHSSTKVA